MTWKDVMNTSRMKPGTRREEAVDLAMKIGYKFFSWNGRIYFIDSGGTIHNTDLRISDLAV